MITQILLAAGLSARMKRSKPLLDFGGMPLLSRLLQECRQSQVDSVMVVLGHERERILEQVDFSGVQVVENPNYQSGQTSSFQSALEAIGSETEAFLNLPVDHPLVTHREIDALIQAYRNREGTSKIFIPTFEGEEGRPVLFEISLREKFLALGPDQPVNGIIEKFRDSVSHVPVENPYIAKDMDTPEDYQECLEIFLKISGM